MVRRLDFDEDDYYEFQERKQRDIQRKQNKDRKMKSFEQYLKPDDDDQE